MKAPLTMHKKYKVIVALSFICSASLQAAQAQFICKEESSNDEDAPVALFKGVGASCSDGKKIFIKPYVVNASSVLKDMLDDGVDTGKAIPFDRFSSKAFQRLESLILKKNIEHEFFYNDIIEFAELCHFLQIDENKYQFIPLVVRALIPYASRYIPASMPPMLEEACQSVAHRMLATDEQYCQVKPECIPLQLSFATRYCAQQKGNALWAFSDATRYSIFRNRTLIESVKHSNTMDPMVALSADGHYGALNTDHAVLMYDIEAQQVCDTIPKDNLLTTLTLDGQGKRIALGQLHGVVQLYDRETKECCSIKHKKSIQHSMLSHDGQSLFFSAGRKMYVYDIKQKETTMLFECDDYIESCKQSETGKYLAVASRDGTVVVYDRDQKTIIDTIIFKIALCSVALTADARYIMVQGRFNRIDVYDRQQQTMQTIIREYHSHIDDMAIVSDNDVHYFVVNNTMYQRVSTLKEILLALRTGAS